MIIHVQLRRCHVCDRPQATRRMIGRATIPQLQGASASSWFLLKYRGPWTQSHAPHRTEDLSAIHFCTGFCTERARRSRSSGSDRRHAPALLSGLCRHYTTLTAPRTQLALHATPMAPHLVDLLDGVYIRLAKYT